MLVFRCTQRTARRFKFLLSDDSPPSTGVLGDWYVNLLNIGPYRLVLCQSARSLLPVILPARNEFFPSRFPIALMMVLQELRIPDQLIETEISHTREHLFAKTRSRQVLGVMNDFTRLARSDFRGISADGLLELALSLAKTPCVALDLFPDQFTVSLFQASRPN